MSFAVKFEYLVGHPPYPWQRNLFEQYVNAQPPRNLSMPTGAGKTSIIPTWLCAVWYQLENHLSLTVPRRLYFSIDRRVVVDQSETITKEIVRRVEQNQELCSLLKSQVAFDSPLIVSVLRGQPNHSAGKGPKGNDRLEFGKRTTTVPELNLRSQRRRCQTSHPTTLSRLSLGRTWRSSQDVRTGVKRILLAIDERLC